MDKSRTLKVEKWTPGISKNKQNSIKQEADMTS